MEKFIKENWFKAGILTILLLAVVLVAVGYSRKPSDTAERSSDNSAQYAYSCSQKANEIDAQENATLHNSDYRTVTTNHFSATQSKCYVYTEVYKIARGYSRNADEFFYSKMRDGYENNVVFSCGAGTFSDVDGGCTDIGSIYDSNFTQEHAQYFTQ